MKNGDSFYPSNGTDGDSFMEKFCYNCTKDTGGRGGKTYCSIVTGALIGKKPKQWIYQDGKPTCTSFVKLGATKTVKRQRVLKGQISAFESEILNLKSEK